MKKPEEYQRFVKNSIALGFLESTHETLNALRKPIFITGMVFGLLVAIAEVAKIVGRATSQTSEAEQEIVTTADIALLILCAAIIVFVSTIRPFINLIGRLYAKALQNRAQAFYDLTGRVPAGWGLNEENRAQEDQQSYENNSTNNQTAYQQQYQQQQAQQQYQQQTTQQGQQFDQQQAYAQYAEHVAHAEQQLNEQKQKLEREWAKLHAEKQKYEQQKANQQKAASPPPASGIGDLFAGCTDEESRKKRYRELLKIYHPDNQNGDTKMVEEVNRQFERRKR